MNIKDMTVGARLAWGFGLVILAGLLIAIYGRLQLGNISEQMTLLVEDRMVKVEQAQQIKDNLNIIARSIRNIALLNDTSEMQKEKERIDQARASNTDIFGKLEASVRGGKGRELISAAIAARGPYASTSDKAIALGLAHRDQETRDVLIKELRPAQSAYFQALDELIAYQKQAMQDNAREAQRAVSRAGLLMLGIAALALALGAVLAWAITRSLTRQLGGEPAYAARAAREIAAGNLAAELQLRAGDQGSLLAAMKDMQQSLGEVVARVRQGSDGVATASSEIASGNHDLSSRTESQASALQQTASSMEQLSSTVKLNADNARQANQLAMNASEVAARGGAVVAQVVDTMRDINESSRRIADIIGVIDGIAFQTNILALNAAVEAARAGEQGRGFAVVASEVRSLASRSAEAAREIKGLIGASVERVEEGSELVNRAGETMQDVVGAIRRVTDIMGEISAASAEQSAGVSQVGEAVSQMDRATQQNAALVEEMAAAATSLKSQAQELVQAVSVFRLSLS